MEIFLGVIFGIIVSIGLVAYYESKKKKKLVNSQSVLLLDKVKKVCKFITVEGDFAEIYQYHDVKQHLLKLISSRKKALVVIKAKAHVGYDLTKIHLKADNATKTIILEDFPQPEVLSIETDLSYYDKSEGLFNKFEATDLTGLQLEAKEHIKEKVPESGLLELAKKEALETVLLMETIVQTIGWTLDYSALKIEGGSPPKLKE